MNIQNPYSQLTPKQHPAGTIVRVRFFDRYDATHTVTILRWHSGALVTLDIGGQRRKVDASNVEVLQIMEGAE